MSRSLRRIAWLFAAVAAAVGYCSCNFATAEARVRGLCAEIRPGMALSDLQAFAREHGLGPGSAREGINYLVEVKTNGRWGCKVIVEKTTVRMKLVIVKA